MKKFLILFLSFSLFSFTAFNVSAECKELTPDELKALPPDQLSQYISDCESKRNELQSEAKTLKSALSLITSKINLTQAQIRATASQITQLEEQINSLGVVISDLNVQLDQLAKVYVSRIRESYKGHKPSVITLFLKSDSFTTFQNKLKYLRIAQKRDEIILRELESARVNFDEQKTTKEEKQKEIEALQATLESQKKVLGVQQSQKNQLLVQTQNDEKKYQALLDQARAELEAIQNIIAGKGTETLVGDVSQNEVIAQIIQGKSCNSDGTHVHFIVSQGGTTRNPFNYLPSINYENCSGSSCGSGDGDAFNPSGSWSWPISPTIKFNQGYGETWAVRNTWVGNIYRFHNGIDIGSPSSEVRAAQSGALYRGSYLGQNKCLLKYVRVDHKDSDLDTFYLHVNYF